ncbi:hypothetical protein [Marinicella sp. W31]|uniref:hypothetical protein n=1 Tax=Marinicella sp. W31 TaxID=3023713 RepID=UPI0037563C20
MPINKYIQSLAIEIEAGEVVPFIGAGVSMAGNSGIPAAWTLKQVILDTLSSKSITKAAKANAKRYENQILNIGLEAMMYRLSGDRFGTVVESLIESIKSCDAFNEMHAFVASLLNKSGFTITTNFDELIEVAAQKQSLNFESIVSESNLGRKPRTRDCKITW